MDKEAGKRRAAEAAAAYVQDGMTLGIGTGSTAKYFIDALGAKVASGWRLKGIPTSEETRTLAQQAGVEIIEPDETTVIDLAVDGADEADPQLNLIKGGGGALLREKIVAGSAGKFIVIADKSKRVVHLGAFPLPVEIEPFAWALTVQRLRIAFTKEGFQNPALELRAFDGAPKKTDGSNLIIDCALGKIERPTALEKAISDIPGVIESGLFCGMTDIIIYGDAEGVSTQEADK